MLFLQYNDDQTGNDFKRIAQRSKKDKNSRTFLVIRFIKMLLKLLLTSHTSLKIVKIAALRAN